MEKVNTRISKETNPECKTRVPSIAAGSGSSSWLTLQFRSCRIDIHVTRRPMAARQPQPLAQAAIPYPVSSVSVRSRFVAGLSVMSILNAVTRICDETWQKSLRVPTSKGESNGMIRYSKYQQESLRLPSDEVIVGLRTQFGIKI